MTSTQFHRRLLAEMRRLRAMPVGGTLVAAVSGGPDSMALLHALADLARRRDTRWRIVVAHLDHQLRGAAAQHDAAFVRAAAELLNLDCRIEAIDVAALARNQRMTPEQAARECRYEFLERIAEQAGAPAVAVGHTADDQAETVLHHILRGTGLTGLAGMPASRPLAEDSTVRLIRPMLALRRADVLGYLSMRRISWRIDKSNRDPRHTRTRLRHELIPLIEKQVNPLAVEAINRLALHARAAAELIADVAKASLAAALRRVDAGDDEDFSIGGQIAAPACAVQIRLDARQFAAMPRLIRTEVLRHCVAQLGGSLRELSQERLDAAADMLERGRGGRPVQFAGGVCVLRQAADVVIRLPRAASRAVKPASRKSARRAIAPRTPRRSRTN